MANRRRSTRRRRRAPIRRVARRPRPAAHVAGQTPAAPEAPLPHTSSERAAVRLPTLPHLRRDLTISLGLGLGLMLVVVAVGLALG